MGPFDNRRHAGKILAERLREYRKERPVVLALPRGGIPVAAEIARALDAPLDILAVKKIGAPFNEELALGAISEDGEPVFNEEVLALVERSYILDPEELRGRAEAKAKEVRAQVAKFRARLPRQEVRGRLVIVVDDGLATGSTMEAAIHVLRKRGVGRIVVAVPVAAPDSSERIRAKVDELVALELPEDFYAVGAWYRDFSQVTDQEALTLMTQLEREEGAAGEEDAPQSRPVLITADVVELEGDLWLPAAPKGLVIFAHGSGSSRKSPRNRQVAQSLAGAGYGSLLFDLLTQAESDDRRNVFDMELLTTRLLAARHWASGELPGLRLAYFGASTGAAAALRAAAEEPDGITTVVSRGGRPDLAGVALGQVKCPVLLIVGGEDEPVLPLTHASAARLKQAEVAIVPGAGHLFEEPGKLEEVVRLTLSWLRRQFTGEREEKPPLVGGNPKDEVESELHRLARPLRAPAALEALAEQFADRRVVMLGESSHGTQEFYALRRELSEILIERHGFRFIAVEGDWPDCQRLNEYVRAGKGESAHRVAEGFVRWPTWMWANEEVVKLVEWMRGWSAGFYGLDVYSLFESIEAVRQTAEKLGIELSSRALELYACFEPYRGDEIAYARSLLEFPEGCQKEVVENLKRLHELRLGTVTLNERELFDAQQNARVIQSAERYYRAMLSGGASSWNVRDQHMMETLDLLLERHGEGAKAIIWAHNTHIGDYHFTDMIDEGYVNLGGLARERYGRDQVGLIGFTTFDGSVLAGRAWGATEQAMELPPARYGSLEEYLHRVSRELGGGRGLFLVFDEEARRGSLAQKLGHRAVGVVYSPVYEASGHNYVPTVTPERYDALVFVDHTQALASLHRPSAPGLFPETWPAGA